MVDEATRKKRVKATAIILGIIAVSFYFSAFIFLSR